MMGVWSEGSALAALRLTRDISGQMNREIQSW